MDGSEVRRVGTGSGAPGTDPHDAKAEGQRRLSALKAMLGGK
jgi:hypothetical protein